MQLSVIILNYNVRYFLEQCVLSVQKALENIDGEIIVVDNASSDDSCVMMRTRFPAIQLIQNKENLGFSKGNNIGVAAAKGDYLCVLNPDTVVAEDTFEKVLAFAKAQKNLGIVGVKLIDGSGNFLPESKRGVPTPWVAFTKVMGLYRWFPFVSIFTKYYAQHLQPDQTGKVDILVGAFMFLSRELYLEVGGFDENCFMYSDDIDLSYQVLQKGKDNFYFHETTVLHYKGESTVKDGTYMKRFQEAMRFFYQKHFRISFFFEIFMELGIILFSILKMFQGKPKHKKEFNAYCFFSEDEKVAQELQLALGKKVAFHALKGEKMVNSSSFIKEKGIEILLDNNYISFQECIAFLELLKNRGFTFKILPKSSNFLIGSDNNNERGTVLKIPNNLYKM
ncbi:Glycosyltransferase, GT2 family [Flavobacterium succinicans]|uniref:Glycosyltransferase, GT2 family n=1 Tax=Flavobacterium succinicans TaxID=29536 RepID=A0A1I4T8Z4_9FLAO|nr:glycosyltransferase family 2 protein [Flavobacterium succinicans]SFM73063.1 Glycosyltransferase, GT2 family [Flavobacterium succinicans]